MSAMACTCYAEDFDNTGIECLWCCWTALFTLAANLATAAMLGWSWLFGFSYGYAQCPCEDYHNIDWVNPEWSPGCGRESRPGHAITPTPAPTTRGGDS